MCVMMWSYHLCVFLFCFKPKTAYEMRIRDWSSDVCSSDLGDVIKVDNPAELPEPGFINELREPIINARILMPPDYVGSVMQLCMEKRGVQKNLRYLGSQVQMEVEMPMAEVVLDFFDRLKSVSRGYASFEYESVRFRSEEHTSEFPSLMRNSYA